MSVGWLRILALLGTLGSVLGVGTYRAAVLEHVVIVPPVAAWSRGMALFHMEQNLKIYDIKAAIAAKEGVDIMVFPEDGLYGVAMNTRAKIYSYLENIPDPMRVMWNPCNSPRPYHEVQVRLSCLAKRNNMYVVANMGDVQLCLKGKDPNCHYGWYQYNTNVVYDRKGNFIARYHKQNRFYEPQFNAPTHPEYIWFDTEFGRFGVVICNDILFYDPIMELIRDHNVTDILFPTAYPVTLPMYYSHALFSSFAVGHSVNLLAANVKLRYLQNVYLGSGLFTPAGPLKYVYDYKTPNAHLIIGDMPINIRNAVKLPCDVNPIKFGPMNMKALVPPIKEFKSQLNMKWVTFAYVEGTHGKMTVCNNGFCCYLEYRREFTGDKYAFGAFSGLHKFYGPIYNQICVLIKCLNNHHLSCGTTVPSADTRFEYFQIKGNFSSPFINPQIVLSAPNMDVAIAPIGTFTYDSMGLQGSATKKPLMHAALYGRVYRKDCITCLYG